MTDLKNIPGYDGYMASKDGRIYSLKTERFLKSKIRGNFQYESVRIRNTFVPTHKLVALAWVEIPEGYTLDDVLYTYKNRTLLVDHHDGNKNNLHADNLKWCTPYENLNALNYDKEQKSKKLKGNKNAVNRKAQTTKAYRFIYTYNGKNYGLNELCAELNCSKSKITESFRRNLGLVRMGLLTRNEYKKGE